MGQAEVLEFLESRRKESNEWLSAAEIREGLEKEGHSNGVLKNLYNCLYKLATYDIIQFKGVGMWHHKKLFRAKKKK